MTVLLHVSTVEHKGPTRVDLKTPREWWPHLGRIISVHYRTASVFDDDSREWCEARIRSMFDEARDAFLDGVRERWGGGDMIGNADGYRYALVRPNHRAPDSRVDLLARWIDRLVKDGSIDPHGRLLRRVRHPITLEWCWPDRPENE